jgi:hypothetical protein
MVFHRETLKESGEAIPLQVILIFRKTPGLFPSRHRTPEDRKKVLKW